MHFLFPAVEIVSSPRGEVISRMSSAAVSAYSARSRASDRTGRIRDNINRSSAYILGNTTDYTGVSRARPRDSSIGTMGRPSSALSRLVLSVAIFILKMRTVLKI